MGEDGIGSVGARLGSRLVAMTRMSNALASLARRAPMRPRPTISMVLPVSWSSRAAISEIMPRQWRASGCRVPRQAAASARISAMACSATAYGVDAGGAGEAYAACAQHVLVVLVDAGADRLDELEVAWRCRQLVLPHHRDDEHVGLGEMLGQLLGGSAPEGGAMPVSRRRETLGHAVGAMRKADPEPVLAGSMDEAPYRSGDLEHAQREVAQQQLLVAPALAHASSARH